VGSDLRWKCGKYNQIQRLSSGWWLVLRGWSRPEVAGIGSEPLAKTGHSSQAEILGVSLNHKSNLFPSGFIGLLILSVGLYVAMGISTLFGVETNNRQLYQHQSTSHALSFVAVCLNRVGLTHHQASWHPITSTLSRYPSSLILCLLTHFFIG